MLHSHTVHLPLGALLSPCTMCGAGADVVLDEALRAGAVEISLRARNKSSGIDRLKNAIAVADDPDPLAALRRSALGNMQASPRSFARAAALFRDELLTNTRARRLPHTNAWPVSQTRI